MLFCLLQFSLDPLNFRFPLCLLSSCITSHKPVLPKHLLAASMPSSFGICIAKYYNRTSMSFLYSIICKVTAFDLFQFFILSLMMCSSLVFSPTYSNILSIQLSPSILLDIHNQMFPAPYNATLFIYFAIYQFPLSFKCFLLYSNSPPENNFRNRIFKYLNFLTSLIYGQIVKIECYQIVRDISLTTMRLTQFYAFLLYFRFTASTSLTINIPISLLPIHQMLLFGMPMSSGFHLSIMHICIYIQCFMYSEALRSRRVNSSFGKMCLKLLIG